MADDPQRSNWLRRQKERDELQEVGKEKQRRNRTPDSPSASEAFFIFTTYSEHLARHKIKTLPKYLHTRRFIKCSTYQGTRQLAIKTNEPNGRCEKKWLTLTKYDCGNSIRRRSV
ncbi:hypothetical protein CEXT_768181 [Caerostris extrusa]|uniref:Uncharacterized protein n=1 Tax=Caerostris extrusa TaxID=172846 RepID=A0AAV4QQ72_CAEEX|nr:hypothetical protein CEXT_768181 [Caerostris extrusa]